ncbi:MAG: hypothetical protein KDD70_14940, partial [Bdellovibrionales bacterium]|nr:hypothetical protein [Bdellovibrionales bacterium]
QTRSSTVQAPSSTNEFDSSTASNRRAAETTTPKNADSIAQSASSEGSALQVAREIGEAILQRVAAALGRPLQSSGTQVGGSYSARSSDAEAVKGELSALAANYAGSPEEANAFQSAIGELFGEVQGKAGAQASQSPSNDLIKKLSEVGITKDTAVKAFKAIRNWDALTSSQKLAAAGDLGIDVLQNVGVFDKEQASDFRGVAQAISVIANGNASNRDKALAVGQALAGLATTSFSGTVDRPTQIGGVAVVGSAPTLDGEDGYLLVDGSIAAKSDIVSTHNAFSALQAVAVLTSDAETEDKISALAGIGIQSAQANDIISDVNAGRLGAALSVFNTVTNWDEMDNGQRIAATLQTADTVITALSGNAASSVGTAAGTSIGTSLLSGAASIAGIVVGVDQAIDVINAIDDLPRSKAQKAGAIGLGSAGAAIGAGIATVSAIASGATLGATIGSAVPIVGTIIGAAVGALAGFVIGSFGSGKSSSQMARDSWRDALEQGNFATVIDGSHHVPLADGTMYNIGKDGGHKLENVDGTERLTVDVDWNNPLASENIATAHLYAIATGVDPTTHKDWWLFNGAAVQGLNAATSNAKTQEDVKANFQAMLAAGGVTPEAMALKVEVLRVSNKISDHEYEVYIHHLNNLYDTSFSPTDRATAHQAIVQQLAAYPEQLPQGEQELLKTLTDPVSYEKSVVQLQERLGYDEEIRIQDEQKAAEEAASEQLAA